MRLPVSYFGAIVSEILRPWMKIASSGYTYAYGRLVESETRGAI